MRRWFFLAVIAVSGCSLDRSGIVTPMDAGRRDGGMDQPDVCVSTGTTDDCDEIDNDCDGVVDEDCSCEPGSIDTMCGPCNDGTRMCPEGAWTECTGGTQPTTYFADADTDGYGDPESVMGACSDTPPEGYVANSLDCDDDCIACNPEGTEVCSGRDEDCNGMIDDGVGATYFRDADGDGFGDASVTMQACFDPDGWVEDDTDCDDMCALCNPDIPSELCGDGRDNDCNDAMEVDDGCDCTFFTAAAQQYLYCSYQLNWANAQAECAIFGGNLVSFETMAENAAVWTQVDGFNQHVWIGGSDSAMESEWVWVSGTSIGTCLADTACSVCPECNWAVGQPSDPGDDCLLMPDTGSGRWDDQGCGDSERFVCEL